MSIDHWQKEKQKTMTIKTKISTLFSVLLISVLLVLSSVAAVQLLATNRNVAFAQSSDITVTGTCDYRPDLGSPDELRVEFIVSGPQPNTFYYYIEIEESTGRVIDSNYYDNFANGYGTVSAGTPGETYTLSWYQDFDGDYNDVGIEESELVASDSVTCTTSPPPEDGGGDTGGGDDTGGGGDTGGGDEEDDDGSGDGDDEEEQPPLTEQFDNQGECIAYADANPDSGITREECNAAFVPGGGCQVTEETDETLEEVCTGGGSFSSGDDEDDPLAHGGGGGGGHGTCTLDKSTDIADCTFSGGSGSSTAHGGGGGRTECTYDNPTGEQDCSFEAGGGGSKPVPNEEGG